MMFGLCSVYGFVDVMVQGPMRTIYGSFHEPMQNVDGLLHCKIMLYHSYDCVIMIICQ